MIPGIRRRAAAAAVLACGLLLALPGAAQAHSLDSSTVAVQVHDGAVTATVSVALDTLATVVGTGSATALTDDDAIAYLDQHLTVTGADGTTWAGTWSDPVREAVEGIDSLTATVTLDPAGSDPSTFVLGYDAIIASDAGHRAVVVLTDAAGEVSTAGVLTSDSTSLAFGDGLSTGLADLVGHGLHHVLGGADHLLFLTTLLLVAPLVAVSGRWRRRDGAVPTARRVAGVVTAFTVGHSLTLIASALGWVRLPTTPVEVLVAASVAVAAVHALRPLAHRGEEVIAGVFGLVHGLAFAGILADLGLSGATSVPALLAFNVGVELAQLATVALVFPSLYVISRTRFGAPLRVAGATAALLVAVAWIVERLGVLANPFAGVEEYLVAHPWPVVGTLAALAVGCRLLDGPDSAGASSVRSANDRTRHRDARV